MSGLTNVNKDLNVIIKSSDFYVKGGQLKEVSKNVFARFLINLVYGINTSAVDTKMIEILKKNKSFLEECTQKPTDTNKQTLKKRTELFQGVAFGVRNYIQRTKQFRKHDDSFTKVTNEFLSSVESKMNKKVEKTSKVAQTVQEHSLKKAKETLAKIKINIDNDGSVDEFINLIDLFKGFAADFNRNNASNNTDEKLGMQQIAENITAKTRAILDKEDYPEKDADLKKLTFSLKSSTNV